MPPKPTAYFSLENQTVDALRTTVKALTDLPGYELAWKWVFIGIHSALQGSFCIALQGSDGIQLLTESQEQQSVNRYDRERKSGKPEFPWLVDKKGKPTGPHVDWFRTLFAKVQDEKRMSHFWGVALEVTDDEREAIERLNNLRNLLLHFGYGSHSESIPGSLCDLTYATRVVKTLLFETQGRRPGNSYHTESIGDPDLSDEAKRLLGQISEQIGRLEQVYQKR